MSLSARLFGLFTSDASHDGEIKSSSIQFAGNTHAIDGSRQNTSLQAMEADVIEQEDHEFTRHPYLNASPSDQAMGSQLIILPVHACWWYWRLQRRCLDALT